MLWNDSSKTAQVHWWRNDGLHFGIGLLFSYSHLSSHILSQTTKIPLYSALILLVLLCGCGNVSLREEQINALWVVGWFLCLAASNMKYQACLQPFKEVGLWTHLCLKSQMVVHVILPICGQVLWKMWIWGRADKFCLRLNRKLTGKDILMK
jgi:hypothetical protein